LRRLTLHGKYICAYRIEYLVLISRLQLHAFGKPLAACRLESHHTYTCALVHNSTDTARRVGRVLVWHTGQGSCLGDADVAVGEDVVPLDSKAIDVRVQVCDDGALGVGEGGFFDQDLRAHTGMHTRGRVVGEAAAIDVAGAEAN